jgi:UDPglucose 6-dehydrogenase
MKICVLGLWHLGSVTAACMAALGHHVVGLDFDEQRVASLSGGSAPLFEPGLEELLRSGLASGRLRFSRTVAEAAAGAQVLWVTSDTPIGSDGEPQPDLIIQQLEHVLPVLDAGTLVLVSSQLPIGSIRALQQRAALLRSGRSVNCACLPENLRLGSALRDFLRPDRIIVGVSSTSDRDVLEELLGTIGAPIEWMSLESAEMTKHALNAFLATSVTFANEVASICEVVGADAKEVERGLKSDRRIGAGAYLAPGAAFAGGTLARDVGFLTGVGRARGITTPLLASILPSNAAHRLWAQNLLRTLFADLSRTTIAVWGLTYKSGTDTLRESPAVELCEWILHEGAQLQVHDPVVRSLPQQWGSAVRRTDSPLAAVRGAQALVLAVDWPVYREVDAAELLQSIDQLVVLDPNRMRPDLATTAARLRYFAVGMPRTSA